MNNNFINNIIYIYINIKLLFLFFLYFALPWQTLNEQKKFNLKKKYI